jgi:uncharacterized metal-binding protein
MRRIIQILKQKPEPAEAGEINQVFFDRFTIAHFLIGCAYGWLQLGFWLTLFLAVVWELIENPLKVALPKMFPRGTADSLRNMVSDTIAVLTGWYLVTHHIL